MLREIKAFVDALVRIAPPAIRFYTDQRRRNTLLLLQESFFILGALIETGGELLDIAVDARSVDLESLPINQVKERYALCAANLNLQTNRLRRLGKIFRGAPFLDFLDPQLRRDLDRAIGEKGKGLYGIGAALFFHQMFGSARDPHEPEQTAVRRMAKKQSDFIQSIMGFVRKGILDVSKHRSLLASLRRLHGRLGAAINELCTVDERVLLAERAVELARRYDYLSDGE